MVSNIKSIFKNKKKLKKQKERKFKEKVKWGKIPEG